MSRKTTEQELEGIKAHNLGVFLKDGPRVGSDYKLYVIARDSKKHRVCLGGLGGMGVGEMWFDEKPDHKDLPGYADAPLVTAPDGPFDQTTLLRSIRKETSHGPR